MLVVGFVAFGNGCILFLVDFDNSSLSGPLLLFRFLLLGKSLLLVLLRLLGLLLGKAQLVLLLMTDIVISNFLMELCEHND